MPKDSFHLDEPLFRTLRELARDGTLSQRDLSRKMGVSLGRVNFLVNALLEKGYIKAQRFKNSKNKMALMYHVTPKGLSTKLAQTYRFLYRKLAEYDRLKEEIELLRLEADEAQHSSHCYNNTAEQISTSEIKHNKK